MSNDPRAKEMLDFGDKLFAKKDPLNGLMQEIAEHFFVERATFTTQNFLGRDFAGHVMDSYPTLVRRELGNSISATLRPRDQAWFATTTLDEDRDAYPAHAQFLEYLTRRQRHLLYDPRTKFVRATKEGDHDFITFGQAVISIEENRDRTHPYYRCHHIRDCAWLENDTGDVDHLHRKDSMTARALVSKFGEKAVHRSIKQAAEKEPGREFPIRCVVLPTDEFGLTMQQKTATKEGGKKLPYTIVYIDVDNGCIIRRGGLPDFLYVVPRWHTIPGFQYAFSPATIIGLPDGRMAQHMARILLEAGEKSVDPPMLAVEEAVREINLQAGSITWADVAYDRKLDDVARPFEINADMKTGFAMRADLRDMLAKAFFIDKLALPEATDKMTATEIRARLEEHVRNLLPLFEPMEHEYNTQILTKSFNLMRSMGLINFDGMPEGLAGADISWSFRNPMQEASTRIKVAQFQEAGQMVATAREMGLGARISPVNFDLALKDAIQGAGVPAKWLKTIEQMDAETRVMDEQEAAQRLAAGAAQAAEVGKGVGEAAAALREGGVIQQPGMQPEEDMAGLYPEGIFADEPIEDEEEEALAA